MSNATQYGGSQLDTSPLPSPFWSDCRWNDAEAGYIRMVREFHDFQGGGKITSPTTEAALIGLPISGFGSSGSTITYDLLKNGGGALILAETTTQEGVVIRSAQAPYQISANKGTFWMEARVKPLLTATNEMGFLVGLIDSTAASATSPITMSSGALADVNLVGHHKPIANTTLFNNSYKADGVTAVVTNTDVGTLVAATYIKLGMKFEPRRGNVLSFYINGVKQSNTKTIPNATGTDFPADVALGWAIAMFVGSAASDNELHVDWVRVAQEIV